MWFRQLGARLTSLPALLCGAWRLDIFATEYVN